MAPQKRKAFRWLAVSLALIAGLMPAWTAQKQSKKDKAEEALPARLVRMDVVALDSSGLPVTDLHESDFQVFDNGKRQTVVFARLNGRKKEQLIVLGPSERSNRTGPALPPATVILFDLMNERVLTDAFGRNEIIQALQGLEQSKGLYLYILTNTGGILPLHPLTNPEGDTEVDDTHWTRQIQPLLDGVLRKIFGLRPMDDHDPGIRFESTVQALSVMGAQLSAVPGRKALVWITHGVPINIPDLSGIPIDMSPMLHRLSAALEQKRIAVYSVQQSQQGAGAELASLSRDTLRQMSSLTGGRAYTSDAVNEAITQARTDARANYTVGYFPSIQTWNGKYHKIRIASTRSGIHFTAKQGYYAFAEPTPMDQEQATLGMAASSPFDSPEIGLRASVSAADDASQGIRIHIRIDPDGLLLVPRGNQLTGKLLVAVQNDFAEAEQGFVSRSDREPRTFPVELNLTPDQRSKAMQEGIAVDVATGGLPHKVRVIVLDRNLREYGTLTIPVS